MVVDQGNLCRLGVIAEQLDIDIRQARGRAVPYRARQVRPKLGHAHHPHQRELAQGAQLARLGIGTKNIEVFAHRVFHLVVVRQRGAGGQAHFAHGAALGRAPLESLFHNDAGRGGGNFGSQGVGNRHGGTLAASAADIVA